MSGSADRIILNPARIDDALFAPLREALIDDPGLLENHNALKLQLDGTQYEHYTPEKRTFVERASEMFPRPGRLP
jgi:hypothetical protein